MAASGRSSCNSPVVAVRGVVGAAGGERKLALARELGRDATVDYRDPEWPERVRAELSDGVDVAFDGVGGAMGAHGSRWCATAGASCRSAWPVVSSRSSTTGTRPGGTCASSTWVHPRRPTSLGWTREVLDDAAAGGSRPVIGQRFPLADAAAAHAAIERRDTIGKTLLVVATGGSTTSH